MRGKNLAATQVMNVITGDKKMQLNEGNPPVLPVNSLHLPSCIVCLCNQKTCGTKGTLSAEQVNGLCVESIRRIHIVFLRPCSSSWQQPRAEAKFLPFENWYCLELCFYGNSNRFHIGTLLLFDLEGGVNSLGEQQDTMHDGNIGHCRSCNVGLVARTASSQISSADWMR